MVRTEAVKAAGPLDEAYFMYAEDKDWCLRMRRAGWRIVVDPLARVRHMGGRSTSKAAAMMEETAHVSRALFFLKNYQGWVRLSIVFWLIVWTTVTFCQHVLVTRGELALASVKGLVRGFTLGVGSED